MESRDGLFKTGILTVSYYQYPGTVVPNLFGTRDPFHGRQSFHGLEGGEGWFQDDSCSFVVHFISMTFTSVPPWIPGH